MKFNIANPSQGTQIVLEIDDEKRLVPFMDKRIAQIVEGDTLGEEFKGYTFRISGGNDKQGFPMVQGVLCATRVQLLLKKGSSGYRPRRAGERKRKSVRGCIIAHDICVINLVLDTRGPAEIPGLTDIEVPKRLQPKRAGKIRKLYGLTKEDNLTAFVLPRTIEKKGKTFLKRPKIQRLVTPVVLQRKRARLALKKTAMAKAKADRQEYTKMLKSYLAERRQSRRSTRKSVKA
eukprot:TRINITY_DN774403_c0_g1_i1.p1 TRINITY_DN774403_c0_g1~~TRINITY_DN774403_c0_g1_i1.p1  ORF type:complete len:233 (+),score=27.91 TRINITY_DN774403_c0_g1_i1:37-735(+)